MFLLLSVGTLHSTHKSLQSTTTQVNNTSKLQIHRKEKVADSRIAIKSMEQLLVQYKKYRMFEKSVRPEEMRHKRHCIVHYIVHTFIHLTVHCRVHCILDCIVHTTLYYCANFVLNLNLCSVWQLNAR